MTWKLGSNQTLAFHLSPVPTPKHWALTLHLGIHLKANHLRCSIDLVSKHWFLTEACAKTLTQHLRRFTTREHWCYTKASTLHLSNDPPTKCFSLPLSHIPAPKHKSCSQTPPLHVHVNLSPEYVSCTQLTLHQHWPYTFILGLHISNDPAPEYKSTLKHWPCIWALTLYLDNELPP